MSTTFVAFPVTPDPSTDIPGLPSPSYNLQCQRTAWEVEPGFLPGAAAFDGTEGQPFGDAAEDIHDETTIVFVGLFRGAGVGQVLGTTVSLPVEEISETDTFGVTTTYSTPRPVGVFVPRASSYAITDTPLQGVAHNIGDGEHYGLLESINSQIRNDGGTPSVASLVPRHRELLYWRLWADAAEASYVAMEADPARGWLHISATTKIKTYFAQSGLDSYVGSPPLSLAFTSAPHSEVIDWRKLVALAHYGGRLALLGETSTSHLFKVFLSADAGLTLEESLSVPDALSALVFYVAARDWLVVLWEDSSSHQIKRKVSIDGGETWSSATNCQYLATGSGSLADLKGTLNDKTGMPHAGGSIALVVTPVGSSTGIVLISQDGGSEWRQVL